MPFTDSWPETIVAAMGILLVAGVLISLIYQGFSTWRARMSVAREQAYRELADETVKAQEQISQRLTELAAEVSQLRKTTAELERLLKTVA